MSKPMNQYLYSNQPSQELNSSEVSHNCCSFSEYLALGASLYMPANRSHLLEDLTAKKLLKVRSVILCTEDAITESDLPLAFENLQKIFRAHPLAQALYVRPRNPQILDKILKLEGSKQLKGVVLPKVDESLLPQYLKVLQSYPKLLVMPTIETSLAFSRDRLEAFRAQIMTCPNKILCIRVGVNDLYALLGLKRQRGFSIYDGPLKRVIDDLVLCFRPYGYQLSAPVFDYLDDEDTLLRELAQDHHYGLWSKSAIHPQQVALIESSCQVSVHDFEIAQATLKQHASAVFKLHGQMIEPTVHTPWAVSTLLRAEHFGITKAPE